MKTAPRATFPSIVLALLAGAFLCLSSLAYADPPSWQQEEALEQSCKSWQKVRRCVTEDEEISLECAAKGPVARFFSLFHGRGQDDEVRVVVVREAPTTHADRQVAVEAPESSASPQASAASEPAAQDATVTRSKAVETTSHQRAASRKVVREHGDLPRCGDGH